MATREEVYEAWVLVLRLQDDLEKAKAEHQRLADERYGSNAELLRKDREYAQDRWDHENGRGINI